MRLSVSLVFSLLVTAALATSNNRVSKRQNNTNAGYELKQGPLDTPWTTKVGTDPWPEYPRPQMQRSEWKNLNGVWQYRNDSSADGIKTPPFGVDLGRSALVPFCLESALSGKFRFKFKSIKPCADFLAKVLWRATESGAGIEPHSMFLLLGARTTAFYSTLAQSTTKQLCSSMARMLLCTLAAIGLSRLM